MTRAAATGGGADDQRVGVVIPVYNRSRILRETLPFVVAQTRLPEQLVIVDDGSSDDTADAAERWLASEPRPFTWKVIRAPHRTAAAARNTGFAEVEDLPYVAFLDSDDHWPRDFLHRATTRLSASPDAVAASADRQFFNADGDNWKVCSADLAADAVSWLFLNDGGISSCSLFRSDTIRQAGGWNEMLESGEDFVLFVAAAQAGRWLHLGGSPVRFNRASEKTHGEEKNLSRRRLEMYREWALQYEQTYAEVGETNPKRSRILRRGVARKWRDCGSVLLENDQADEAAEAFAAALSWSPLTVGLRLRWLMAKLAARRTPLRQAG